MYAYPEEAYRAVLLEESEESQYRVVRGQILLGQWVRVNPSAPPSTFYQRASQPTQKFFAARCSDAFCPIAYHQPQSVLQAWPAVHDGLNCLV